MKLELSNRRLAVIAAGLLAVAGTLSYQNIPLASAAMGGATLVARYVAGTLPTEDPDSTLWNNATPVTIPLSAQNDLIPRGGGSVTSLSARALNNGTTVAIRIEYTDASNNFDILKKETYRDSAALQFPLAGGMGGMMDACMGGIMMAPTTVNIWHWKADWDRDRLVKYQEPKDDYPNMAVDSYPFDGNATYYAGRAAGNVFSQASKPKVENTNATGPSTTATSISQSVAGKGVYAGGQWKVVFARPMTTTNANDQQFARGQTTGIAFAVWNGGNNERNGMKSTSSWQNLSVQ